MKMPSKMKKKWLKALRSGEYGQTKEVLTNGKGEFCCLGVLQHVVSGGSCEVDKHGNFEATPTAKWYRDNGIKVEDSGFLFSDQDPDEATLVGMNDGEYDMRRNRRVQRSFKTIANWIEKNIGTTD